MVTRGGVGGLKLGGGWRQECWMFWGARSGGEVVVSTDTNHYSMRCSENRFESTVLLFGGP